jgi:hypothetical protein
MEQAGLGLAIVQKLNATYLIFYMLPKTRILNREMPICLTADLSNHDELTIFCKALKPHNTVMNYLR